MTVNHRRSATSKAEVQSKQRPNFFLRILRFLLFYYFSIKTTSLKTPEGFLSVFNFSGCLCETLANLKLFGFTEKSDLSFEKKLMEQVKNHLKKQNILDFGN